MQREKDLIHTCACVQLLNVWTSRLDDAERRGANAVLCEFASEAEVYQSLKGCVDPLLRFVKVPYDLPRGCFWLTLKIAGKKYMYRSKDDVLPEWQLRMTAAAMGISGQDRKVASGAETQNLATSTARCANCDKKTEGDQARVCGGCRIVYYCDTICQKRHWKNGHKKVCRTPFDRCPREMPSDVASELDDMMRKKCSLVD